MTKKNTIHSTAQSDPLKDLPIGHKIKFEPKLFTPQIQDGIETVKNWEVFEGMIVATSFMDKHGNEVDGSAILVAPGVAICATHVIESRLSLITEGKLSFSCFGINSQGLTIWRVKKLTLIPNTDFTILGIELASEVPNNNIFYQAAITTRTPSKNESLLLCGFKSSKKRFELKNPTSSSWTSDLYVSQGQVTNRFLTGRDQSMIPWPCLEVDTLALGGMSGGPVFDKMGHLVGLICSSIELGEKEGVTYISLIWPVLACEFEAVWPSGFYKSKTDLLSLNKLCFIDKRDAILIERDKNLKIDKTRYRIWE